MSHEDRPFAWRPSPPSFVAFHNARAVEDPPQAHLQLVEVEQQTPYLESFAGVTAGTATTSIIRRVVPAPGPRAGLRPVRQPQRRRQPRLVPARRRGRRQLRPLRRAREGAELRHRAAVHRRPPDRRRRTTCTPRRSARADPIALGAYALSEGRHMLTMKVVGKNDASTDFLGGIDLLVLDSTAAPQPTPTAVATAEVGAHGAGDARADARGRRRRSAPFQPGVAQGVHGRDGRQRRLDGRRRARSTVSDPGHLANGTFTLPEPLRVEHRARTPGATPVSNATRRDQASSRRSRPPSRCAPAPTRRR